ncbi:PHOSPHATASE [Salix purpurea]|uniref:3'(2'),5'-bisphosphate nucleotidase n=1 Tax=Salix purpurea TaxID=77065 RepID=A0A9Q1AGE5_SALPP|nr:PHOSPHATASE [Salix purpurea]
MWLFELFTWLALLCQRVQEGLVSSTSNEHVMSKDDDSLVTVADWSVQAIVSWMLSESLSNQKVSIVAEEDVQTLSKSDSVGLLTAVVNTVNECLAEAPKYGLQSPKKALGTSQILEAISQCNSTGGRKGRHWVLDPVDGTLGFVRGDQYAVALALIEEGKIVIGVLGCPNYPRKKEWLSHHHSSQTMPKMSDTSETWEKGCVMYAQRGSGEAWMQPLIHGNKKHTWSNSAQRVQVSSIDDPALTTFCEPVERANTNHSFSAGVAHSMGFKKQPLRVHSMVKYAAIARGDAEIFMKFAQSGYKEKIWDHAAGVIIVEEAGGVVTDVWRPPPGLLKGFVLRRS